MEKGNIRSISGHNSGGIIADAQGRVLNFNSSNIIGRDRIGLRVGDQVWFERIGVDAETNAINIRKC